MHQTRRTHFKGLEMHRIVSTTFRTLALRAFCEHYYDNTITKDAIFDYVYGVLHAPSYREDVRKRFVEGMPRIPFAPDFHAFAEAGKCPCSNSTSVTRRANSTRFPSCSLMTGSRNRIIFDLTEKAMRFATPAKTTLTINEHVIRRGNRHPRDGASVCGQRQNAAGVVH